MKSNLSYSLSDKPILNQVSLEQQTGAHVISTAFFMSALDKHLNQRIDQDSIFGSINNFMYLERSLMFFKSNSMLLDVLLNQEPMYIAAQILGLKETDIDEHADWLEPLYQTIDAATHALAESDRVLSDAIGRHVTDAVGHNGSVRYEIFVNDVASQA